MNAFEDRRVCVLNGNDIVSGSFVLYWMQQSQRASYNNALCYAIKLGNSLNLPVIVFFGIDGNYPEANLRHYKFMLEGLAETESELKGLGIRMVTWIIHPVKGVTALSERAAAVVADAGYLRHQSAWRREAASLIKCRFIAVEADVAVPVNTASSKEEYSAATLRPKITELMKFYCELPPEIKPEKSSLDLKIDSADLTDVDSILNELHIDRSVPAVNIRSGTSEAVRTLENFKKNKLDSYHDRRSEPSSDFSSGLSPYIHFGQISAVFIASEIMNTGSPGRDSFIEELIVRRELSVNYVHFNERYDSFESIPAWALATLKKHKNDKRDYLYTKSEFEQSLTHDIYWNAAQNELITTGRIHNYMRMYWGKKIIEWTEAPEEAFDIMLYLNNRYALDGRDVNSYAGIAWCFGKHDRPWKERPVFGTVRYMNENGLKRKFDMSGYIAKFTPPSAL